LADSFLEKKEDFIEMNNGCICCTVRGDLIAGLKQLFKTAFKNNQSWDALMIETTGLADPAPVAQTFFASPFVQSKYYLDGFLTLVDAHHIIQRLDEEKPAGTYNEAVDQIAFADRLLLNKCDLVDEIVLDEVEKRIRMINQTVPIKRTINSDVPMDFILGIQAFSVDRIMGMDEGFLSGFSKTQHDSRVSSVGVHVDGEVDQQKFNEWIGLLLTERGEDLFRTKSILAVKGRAEKYVSHSIHMIFQGNHQTAWQPGEKRECKIVFIGRNLNRQELKSGFMKCMVS
jgi:G3E family GTPase